MSDKYWKESEFPTRAEMKKQAETLKCPVCKESMGLRWRKIDSQPFFSCSRYHSDGCNGGRNWTGEPGFTDAVWVDTLQKEGKIDPDRAGQIPLPSLTSEKDAEFWRNKFLVERAFVMQQLSDIKAAYTILRGRVEDLERIGRGR